MYIFIFFVVLVLPSLVNKALCVLGFVSGLGWRYSEICPVRPGSIEHYFSRQEGPHPLYEVASNS